MRALARAALGIVFAAAACWSMPSCIATEPVEDVACAVASDCPQPYVCCKDPRIPSEDTPIPSCQDIDYCDSYLPFLIEGQPCGRGLPVSPRESPQGPCSEGLECCRSTLTCGKVGACAAPVPAVATSSEAPCQADGDCGAGEICCNIDFFSRANGKCRSLSACGAESAPTE